MPRNRRRTQRHHRRKRRKKHHRGGNKRQRTRKRNLGRLLHRKCYITRQCAKGDVCDYTYIPKFPFGKRYGVGRGTCRPKRHAKDRGTQCSIM